MRPMMLPMLFLLCVPISAQHSAVPYVEEGNYRCEVYALAGYSSLWQPGTRGYFYPGNPAGPNWDGGYFGVGATDGQSTFLFAQFAAGVAIQLNDRFYVRPQFRLQVWGSDAQGRDTTGLTAGIALGYRF